MSGSGVAAWNAGFNLVPDFELGIVLESCPRRGNDPPIFESQAAYLDRHDLLLPKEKKRLRETDFEPERLYLRGWSRYEIAR
jgi:hypothetical protein